MDLLEDLRRRVERLEARAAIGELVSAYAVACDEHDMPRLTSLFTPDARFDTPSGIMVANGRDAIAAMFVKTFKIRGPGYHWTHDHFCTPDEHDPDRATGLVFSHAETTPNGVMSLAAMRYKDTYRRQDGRWLFASRSLEFLYYVPAADYDGVLKTSARLHAGGRQMPADYPESLPAWRAFEAEHGKA